MVSARSSGSRRRAQLCQILDQLDQAAPQQRLTAGEPHLFDAEAHKQLDQAEVFVDCKFGILCADARPSGSRRTCSCSGR